jgi:hypothetical protein
MIHDAVFRKFPAGTLRKHIVSGQEFDIKSGDHIQLPLLAGFYWFQAEPGSSGHRNTASMKSQEKPGTDRFLARIIVLRKYPLTLIRWWPSREIVFEPNRFVRYNCILNICILTLNKIHI